MNKPVIGIISKHSVKEEIRPNTYIRDEVKQVIFDNGGIAIGILLPKEEVNDVQDKWENNLNEDELCNLIAQIKLCNGIIFQGGSSCDNYEMIVAKYCYNNDIPTLGLCCGQNVMVRALGGTTKKVTNPEKHYDVNDTYVDDVFIYKNTKIYDIIKKEQIKVNSRHKKTVDTHPNLIVSAICEDGYSEVVEAEDKIFYIAVRYHPESLYKIDEDHNKLFKQFIKVCANEREKNGTRNKQNK